MGGWILDGISRLFKISFKTLKSKVEHRILMLFSSQYVHDRANSAGKGCVWKVVENLAHSCERSRQIKAVSELRVSANRDDCLCARIRAGIAL